MPKKIEPTKKRSYVHYTLAPDEILWIAEESARLGISQSQMVSEMIRLIKSMGTMQNVGIIIQQEK